MTKDEIIKSLMQVRNILHKQEEGKEITPTDIILAHDQIDIVIDDLVDKEFKRKQHLNDTVFSTFSPEDYTSDE